MNLCGVFHLQAYLLSDSCGGEWGVVLVAWSNANIMYWEIQHAKYTHITHMRTNPMGLVHIRWQS